mmetsp:Transcript_30893/g.88247  ORF Transcript_30893/g.88247 Transcript_30893/m.88247 type:complete len:398 (-) Transcript_30893:15-1208(-)
MHGALDLEVLGHHRRGCPLAGRAGGGAGVPGRRARRGGEALLVHGRGRGPPGALREGQQRDAAHGQRGPGRQARAVAAGEHRQRLPHEPSGVRHNDAGGQQRAVLARVGDAHHQQGGGEQPRHGGDAPRADVRHGHEEAHDPDERQGGEHRGRRQDATLPLLGAAGPWRNSPRLRRLGEPDLVPGVREVDQHHGLHRQEDRGRGRGGRAEHAEDLVRHEEQHEADQKHRHELRHGCRAGRALHAPAGGHRQQREENQDASGLSPVHELVRVARQLARAAADAQVAHAHGAQLVAGPRQPVRRRRRRDGREGGRERLQHDEDGPSRLCAAHLAAAGQVVAAPSGERAAAAAQAGGRRAQRRGDRGAHLSKGGALPARAVARALAAGGGRARGRRGGAS